MFTHDTEADGAAAASLSDKGVGGASKLIVDGISKTVVCRCVCAEGDDPAAKSLNDLFYVVDIPVDDQAAVIRKEWRISSISLKKSM